MCIRDRSLRTVRNVVSRDLEEEAIISEELVSAIGDENIAIPVVDMDILDVAPVSYTHLGRRFLHNVFVRLRRLAFQSME